MKVIVRSKKNKVRIKLNVIVFKFLFIFCLLTTLSFNQQVFSNKYSDDSIAYIDTEVQNSDVIENSLRSIDIAAGSSLEQFQNAKELYLFSHGRPGELYIQKEWFSPQKIAGWIQKQNLENLEQLHIYGCNFGKGKKGERAINYLEQILDISISASTNITGKGGDWELEIGTAPLINIKDYPATLQSIGGTINTYASVTTISGTTFTVDDASSFTIGDLVMIIQMKGAVINTSDTSEYGSVIDYNGVGNYELVNISGISTNDISFASVSNTYDVNGTVQIIEVPDYSANALTTVTSEITGIPFDGAKGGVIALKADVLRLDANINMTASGFRGGAVNLTDGVTSGYIGASGAQKGEGIAGFTVGDRKRGKQANGGGAGNWTNAGGAGGGNFGVGGRGGEYAGSNVIQSGGIGGDAFGGCGNGLGGQTPTVIRYPILGGGGGAGDSNNGGVSVGGIGGGIIFIFANEINGNGGSILANGENGDASTAGDGSAGGGAGGTFYTDATTFSGTISVSLIGGNGGNAITNHSSGGGGGGGAIFLNGALPAAISLNASGGSHGTGSTSTTPEDGFVGGLVNTGQVSPPEIINNQSFSLTIGNFSNGDSVVGVSDPGNGIVDANVSSGSTLSNWAIVGPTDAIGIFQINGTTGGLTVADASVLTSPRDYSIYVQVENTTGEISCVKEITISLLCEYGSIDNIQNALTASPNANASWGTVDGAAGAADITSSGTDVVANRTSIYDATATVLSYSDVFSGGSKITIYTRRWNGSYPRGMTVAFSEDNIAYTTESSEIIPTSETAGVYDQISYTIPNSMVGSYQYIRLTPAGGTQSLLLIDAVSVTKEECFLCPAGVDSPTLSSTTIANICPVQTFDLTSITASNGLANTTLTWHTGTPATNANKVGSPTAVTSGIYYAAFYNATNDCYSGVNGEGTTKVQTTGDADCDGVLDITDIDDDNDGVLDCIERGDIMNCSLDSVTRIGYIPNTRDIDGDNGYTIDGGQMSGSSTLKIESDINFSLSGTVASDVVFVPMTENPITEAGIEALNLDVVFIGGIGNATITYLSVAETDAIKDWSVASSENMVLVTNFSTERWGYTFSNIISNPNLPTAEGEKTIIFRGPFGNLVSFDQAGGVQGSLSGGDGISYAKNSSGGDVILRDNPTGDLIVSDVDILTSLGGVSSGAAISTNNDRVMLNIFAYVIYESKCSEYWEDTDNDTIANRYDLDSDGDGCSDSVESGNTLAINNDIVNSNTGVDANNNGLLDQFEDGTTGDINYTSTYYYSLSTATNVCTDTDGDGIGDLVDIDDDNDGVLDTTELSCGDATASNTNVVLTAGSQLIEGTFSNGGANATYAIDLSDASQALVAANAYDGAGVHYIWDDRTTNMNSTITITPAANSTLGIIKWGPDLTEVNDADADNLAQMIMLTWTPGVTATVRDPNVELDLADGSVINSGSSIVQLANSTNGSGTWYIEFDTNLLPLTFTLTTTHTGAANFVYEGFTIQSGLCELSDTDGDTTPNHLDLDSDGDSCSDSVESSNTLVTNNDIINYNTGTDANSNGLLDQFEDGSTGNINYPSTYVNYATDNMLNACLDTDGDAVGDLVDIDDDNDGVLDVAESQSCSSTVESIITPVAIISIPGAPFTIDCNTEGSLSEMIDEDFSSTGDGCRDLDWTVADDNQGNGLRLTLSTAYDNISEFYLWNDVNLSSGTNDGIQNFSIKLYDASSSLIGTETGFVAANAGAAMQSFSFSQSYNGVLSFDLVIETTYTRAPIQIREIAIGGPSAICTVDYDTDGDTIPNRLDLDSDGDGCSDSVESSNTLVINNDIINYNTGTDANNNGLLDQFEDGTTGNINYVSTYINYGLSDFLNACSDTDGDGTSDLSDLDDDNDGVLDATESPDCYYTEAEALTLIGITSGLISPDDDQSDGDIQILHDGANTYTFNYNAGQTIPGSDLLLLEFPTPVSLSDITLINNTTWGVGVTAKLQGSLDGETWVDLTGSIDLATTTNKVFTNGGVDEYFYYKILGDGGANTVATTTIGEVTYTINSGYNVNLHPKLSCTTDTDTDTIYNHLDLDSDGDGCSDSVESGNTLTINNDIVNFNTGTDANNNGLLDQFEDGTTGNINYTSTYYYALSAVTNVCADTDGDGVGDLTDLDDDNDGILDTTELSCGVGAAAVTTTVLTAGSQQIEGTYTNGSAIADYDIQFSNLSAALVAANIVPVEGGLHYVVDDTNLGSYETTIEITPQTGSLLQSIEWGPDLLGNTDAENDNDEQTITLTWTPSVTAVVVDPDNQLDLVDGTVITSGQSIFQGAEYENTNPPTWKIVFNTNLFPSAFQLTTAHVALAGVADLRDEGFSIVSNICFAENTDGDGSINSLDLDSDADGCSDSVESGNTLVTSNDIVNYNTGTDANNNGLLDQFEDGTTGNINYTSTYTNYATDNTFNVCLDTDGDGVGDLIDIDDDNDGVLDVDEGECLLGSISFSFDSDNESWEISDSTGTDPVDHNTDAAVSCLLGNVTDSPSGGGYLIQFDRGSNNTDFQSPSNMNRNATTTLGGNFSFEWINATMNGSGSQSITSLTLVLSGGGTQVTTELSVVGLANTGWQSFSVPLTVAEWGVDLVTVLGDLDQIKIEVETINSAVSNCGAGGEFFGVDFVSLGCGANLDTDTDTIYNHLDLDSDGDGCSDSVESGNTLVTNNDIVNYNTGTDANNNGLLDQFEDGTTGNINYTSTYYYGVSAVTNVCADTDGDGIGDLVDLDDDNDGILDTTELSCGVGAAAVTTTVLTAGSQQIEGTYTNGSAIADYDIQFSNLSAALVAANIVPVEGGLHYVVDDTNLGSYETTIEITPQTGSLLQSIEWGPDLLGNTDAENDNDEQTITLTWTPSVTAVVVDPDNQLDLADGSIITSGQAIFQGAEYENTNPPTWKIVFNTNLFPSAFQLTTSHVALAGVADLRDEGFSIISNICYSENTDGDGQINSLDLDSDADGCSDSVESDNTLAINNDIVNYNTGTDANNNGLLDQFEDGTTGNINYISTYTNYALSDFLNTCSDTDGDGINDLSDLDDDNDGALDATESPDCYYASDEVAIVNVTTSLTNYSTNAAYQFSELYDGVLNNIASYGVLNTPITGETVYELEMAFPVELSEIDVVFNYSIFRTTATFKWQGYNGSSWVDVTGVLNETETTNNTYTYTLNVTGQKYSRYRLLGVSGDTYYNRIYEIVPKVGSDYKASLHPKLSCTTDSDTDTIYNHLDLDSDGDGCSDSVESGNTLVINNDIINYNTGTDANNNGLLDQFEDGTTGNINYTSTYYYAIYSLTNACIDTDGDGISDLVDIDDDNDGVLDSTECDEAPTVTNGTFDVDASGWTIAPSLGAASGGRYIINNDSNWEVTMSQPITVSPGDQITVSMDLGSLSTSVTYQTQDGFDVYIGDQLLGTAPGNIGGTMTPYSFSGTNTLSGITDLKIVLRHVHTGNNDLYIDNIEVSGYNGSACATDTDGDTIPDRLDLDSDGDGCSDSVESGNTLVANNDIINYNTGTDANNNGLLDQFEDGTTGNINYTSTYTSYALDNIQNFCIDTDGDGVSDVVDVDDDNDGIYDEEEKNCIETINPSGLTWHGTAASNISSPTATTLQVGGAAWSTAYSDQTFSLPITIEGTVSAAVNGMLGIFPESGTEITGATWNDGGYKFQFNASNGMYVRHGATTPGWIAPSIVGTTFRLEIDASGTMNYWHNGSIIYTNTVPLEKYKITVSRGSFTMDNFSIVAKTDACTDIDSDSDTIPDHLELDSDNDGCSDANEAYANSNADGGDGGQYGVGDPLTVVGGEVNADGSVITAAYTTGVVAAVTDPNISTTCPLDTDGDGIENVVDLDDDNDGILDSVECADETVVNPISVSSTDTDFTSPTVGSLANTMDGNLSTYIVDNAPSGGYTDVTYIFPVSDLKKLRIYNNGGSNLSDAQAINTIAEIKFYNAANNLLGALTSVAVPNGAGGNPYDIDVPYQNVTRVEFLNLTGLSSGICWRDIQLVTTPDDDGDGSPNCLDLDSDNDGISDLVESGADYVTLDPNNNGFIDGVQFVDADNDGLSDAIETTNGADTGTTPNESVDDVDTVPDYLDLDSDGDELPDAIEAQLTATYATNYTNDGDVTDDDSDGDGVIDIHDSVVGFGGSFNIPENTDGADNPDYLDTDSDNDGITDNTENGADVTIAATYLDPNGNIDDPATDFTNAQNTLTAEVDYRDATYDTTDLVVSKTVNNTTPDEGDTVIYTITLTNSGPATATNVSITDLLPTGVSYVSDTPSQGSYVSGTGVWSVGSINDSSNATLSISATVDAGTSGDTITNTVSSVSLDQTDSNTTTDDPSEAIVVGNTTDLVVSKTVNNTTPDEGDTVIYTITLTNSGPATATNVSITDLLPTGVSYVSDTPSQGSYVSGTGVWSVGSINDSSNATLSISATVDAGTSGDTITNTVSSVSLDQTDSNTTTDDPSEAIVVGNTTDLVVSKTVNNTTPDEGDTVIYTITLTNSGPATATNVSITDLLPTGVSYVSDTPSQGSYVSGTGVWSVGSINDSSNATLSISATVDAGTSGDTITNTVSSVSLDQTDSNTTTDDPSEAITVNNTTDLVVSKTVNNTTPDEGDTVIYTITLTNSGPATATNVSITDLLPTGVTYVSDTPSQGSYVSGTGVWSVGSINDSGNATLSISATVDAGTSGDTITNTVSSVSLDQTDSNTTTDDPSEAITINNTTDLVVSKTVNNATPDEGDTVIYTITLTNSGPATATNVSITDLLPTGVSYVSDTPSQGSYVSGTGVWSVGSINDSSNASLSISATVDAGTSGDTITNTVSSVSLDQTDSNTTTDDPSEAIVVGNTTDLVVSKTVNNTTPNEGDTVIYTITLTNSGPATATNVSITDLLPTGVSYVSDTPSQGSYVSGTGVWSVGSINDSSNATLSISATVDAGTSGDTITNTVSSVSLDQTDSNTTTDDPSENIVVGNTTDLVVSKTVNNTTPDEGDTVIYTITLTNSGPATATNVSITDLLPTGVSYVSDTPSQGSYVSGTGVWSVGSINDSSNATLSISATVDAGTSGDTITNTVSSVSLDQTDSNTTTDDPSEAITVNNTTDLVVSKTVNNTTPDEGDTVIYTITLTNSGPATATNVSITDLLPTGVSYVSDTPSQGSYVSGTGVWSVGSINDSSNATLSISATVDAGTSGDTITNTVSSVSLDQTDSNTTTDDPSEAIVVGNTTDLVVSKTVNNTTPDEGDTVIYTITLTNSGPATATNVSITDLLPTGVSYVSDTPSQGSYVSGTGVWSVGSINDSSNATLSISATVDAGTSGDTITNTVSSVSLDQTDSNTTTDDPSEAIVVGNTTDLVVSKTVNNTTPDEGDTVIYTITLTNSGPATATNVSITDLLPTGVSYVSDTPSQGSYVSGTGVWSVGSINDSSNASLSISATVDAGTSGDTITNTVSSVSLDQTDSNTTTDDPSEAIVVGNTTDLVVSKTVNNTTPDEGDTVIYTITLTNSGPATATNVSITDLLPTGVTYVSDTPSQGSYVSGTGVWSVGSINDSSNASLSISATVDAGTSGDTITNTVSSVSLDQTDSNTTTDDPSEAIVVGNTTDLVVSKTVNNTTPDEGDTVIYTITLTNSGPATATNVSITDLLPTGVSYVSDTPSQGSYVSGTGVWSVGSINDSSNASLSISATVDAGTSGDTITNTVSSVSLDQTDSNTTTDDPSEAIVVGNTTDLVVSKTVNNTTPDEGDTVIYTITLTNSGPATATNVSITDLLPTGVSYVSDTPSQGSYVSGTGVWSVGSINDSSNATLSISATVDAGTSGDTITNTVSSVSLDQTDSNTTTDDPSEAITINNTTDLVVSKTVNNATPDEGDTVIYTITLTNSGPATATNVSITDLLPTGVSYVSDTPSQGSYVSGTGVWSVGSINDSSNASLSISATVDAGTSGDTITNTVSSVSLDQTDSNTTTDDPSEAIVVGNTTDLVVSKTVNNTTPDEGDTVIYTITLTNSGPATATNVSITDLLPTGVSYVSDTPSQGSYVSGTGVWSVGSINDSSNATLSISATVDAGTSGDTITNTVSSVSLDQTDSNTTTDDPSEAITVNNTTDLVVSKTVNNTTPDEGDTVIYTITLTNSGPATATNVSITDLLPTGVSYVSDTPSQGTYVSGTGVWSVGSINDSSNATLSISATVDTGTSGDTITNTVSSVSLDQTDSNTTTDDPSEAITVNNTTDLVVSKTVNNTTPDEGDTVIYTITLTNSGPATATNVSITDLLPTGVSYVSDTPSQGSYVSGTGVWSVGSINDSSNATLSISATVDAGTSGDTITNTVSSVSLDQTDSNTTTDDPSEAITVNNTTDLVVSKTVNNTTPDEGDTVIYTITLTNSGPATATNVSITDLLPTGVSYVSDTPSQGSYVSGTGVWSVGSINDSSNATLSISATVDAGTSGDTITNTVSSVSLDQTDSNTTTDDPSEAIVVGNTTDLVVSKTVNNTTPDEGDTVIYTITLTNSGPAIATNVSITDLLPTGVSYVSDTPSQGSYVSGTGVWSVGSINDSSNASLSISATVDAGTSGDTITNTVSSVSLDQTDSNTTTDDPSEAITVNNTTDLVVSKTVNNTTPDEGDTVIYTITLTNSGPATATNVSITDLLPTGVSYVSDTPSQGSYVSGTGVWSVGSINDSSNATLSISATVDAGTSGDTITNTVSSVSLDQTDSNTTTDDPSGAITINNTTDLVVSKTVNNTTPDEGDTVIYTITLTNSGPATATNVSITDLLPTGVSYVSDTPSQGSYVSGTGVWSVGSINDSSNATLSISATVDASTSGDTITNTVSSVSLDQTDSNTTTDDPSEAITINNTTDLVVSKTVNNTTPDEGDTVIYTITLTNSGPATATNVSITDLLPTGVSYVSDTPSQGSYVSGTGVWSVGSINDSSNATLSISATVDSGTSGDTITNTVSSVSLDQTDSNTTTDDPSEAIVVGNTTDLVVSKTVNNTTPDEGDTVTYTITLTNSGPATATNVSITDLLPTGVTYVSDTPSQGSYVSGTGVWSVGSINDSSNATLSISATVDAGTSGDTITNTVSSVSLDQNDSNTTTDDPSEAITVNNTTDLVVSKTVNNTTPDEGDTVIYTITLTNSGPATATNVSITDLLPTGVSYVSDTPSQGSYVSGTGVWSVGSINDSSNATLNISATVDAGTNGDTITNTVSSVSLDQTDSNTTTDDPSENIVVGNSTDLVVSKTVNNTTPDEGDTVIYTITLTNSGPATATNVSITDLLPTGVSYVSDTPSQGSYVSGTGVWSVGSINDSGNATLSISATVDAGTSGDTITNTVSSVSLDQTDSNTTADDPSEDIVVGNTTDLVVSKTVNNTTPNEGDTVIYTITLTNSGPATATNVSITDLLPTGVSYVSDTPSQGSYVSGTGVWSVGSINDSSNATLSISATVDAGTSGDTITNTVSSVSLDQTDSNTTTDDPSEDIVVGNTTDLVVSKTVNNTTPDEGDTVIYTITLTNSGPATATNVSITDLLPTGVSYVSDTPSQGSYVSGTGVWSVGSINDSSNATLSISATVDAGTSGDTITNTVSSVSLDQTDSNTTTDDSSEDIVVGGIDLVIEKGILESGPYLIEETYTYSILVSNNSLNDATNVLITDQLPSGITYLSNNSSEVYNVSTGVWNVGTVTAGNTIELEISFTVDDTSSGMTITNIITEISLDQTDVNETPDDLEESIDIEVGEEDGITIFSAMSPNGDGINDVFVIDGIERFENTLEIYNRWGVKVYGAENYGRDGNFFRGTSNGRNTIEERDELPVGTYYYILKYVVPGENSKSRAGYLYINR